MFNELRLFFFYGPLKQTKQQYTCNKDIRIGDLAQGDISIHLLSILIT